MTKKGLILSFANSKECYSRWVSRWAGYLLGTAQAGHPNVAFKAREHRFLNRRQLQCGRKSHCQILIGAWKRLSSPQLVPQRRRAAVGVRLCHRELWRLRDVPPGWWRAPRANGQAGSDCWGGGGRGGRDGGSVISHSLYNQWISPGSHWRMTNLAEKEHLFFFYCSY